MEKKSAFLQHYIDLDLKYKDSCQIITEQMNHVTQKIRSLAADQDNHYKYWVYLEMNPELKPSPFLNRIDLIGRSMTKFRVGSHLLKIETGRWSRMKRDQRLCSTCGELGDEFHALYYCSNVYRGDLANLPPRIADIWEYEGVNTLFKRLREADMIE